MTNIRNRCLYQSRMSVPYRYGSPCFCHTGPLLSPCLSAVAEACRRAASCTSGTCLAVLIYPYQQQGAIYTPAGRPFPVWKGLCRSVQFIVENSRFAGHSVCHPGPDPGSHHVCGICSATVLFLSLQFPVCLSFPLVFIARGSG